MILLKPVLPTSFRLYVLVLSLSFLTLFSHAQQCSPVKGLKDSCSTTHMYVSWNAHAAARSYKASYWDGQRVVDQFVSNPRVRFARTANAPFELVSVQAICTGGTYSEPEYEIKGGIVITLDIIYRQQRNCVSNNNPGFVLFSDVCMVTDWNTLCNAIDYVTMFNEDYGPQEINDAVNEAFLAGTFYWEPWPEIGDCGQESPEWDPLRWGETEGRFRVYPNPFSSSFSLEILPASTQEQQLLLMDMQGRTLFSQPLKLEKDQFFQKKIDLTALPSGLYFLSLWGEDERTLIRLVKE